MNDPKTTPMLGRYLREGDTVLATDGMSQYAYVAMTFHAALAPVFRTDDGEAVSVEAFNHADAFFAELAKRTE